MYEKYSITIEWSVKSIKNKLYLNLDKIISTKSIGLYLEISQTIEDHKNKSHIHSETPIPPLTLRITLNSLNH